jgi:hypothetical protein
MARTLPRPQSRLNPIDHSRPLTQREQAFVDSYVITRDVVGSAEAAGYTVRGAQQALQRPRVALAIAQAKREWNNALSASRERLQAELAAVAFSDPMDMLIESESGYRVRTLSEIPEHARRAIASIRVNRDGTAYIKLWDKLEASRLLAQLSGWLDSTTVFDQRTQVVIPALSSATLDDLRALASGEPEGPFDQPLSEAVGPPAPPEAHTPAIDEGDGEWGVVDG